MTPPPTERVDEDLGKDRDGPPIVAVSGRSDMPRRVQLAREVVAAWEKLTGEPPLLVSGLAEALHRGSGHDLESLEPDVIITVGGDGTILWTLMHNNAPVLGVNDGELGFLTEVPPARIEADLARLQKGEYFIESRERFDVTLNGELLGQCTNELVAKTPRPSKILRFRVWAGSHELDDVRADGLILATPTGSTSYAMSAGGPLVHPALDAIIMVPLAPFRVSLRPLVLPSSLEVHVSLAEEEKEAVLALDGQVEHALTPGDELTITRSNERARFVRFEPHFLSRLRELFG